MVVALLVQLEFPLVRGIGLVVSGRLKASKADQGLLGSVVEPNNLVEAVNTGEAVA